MMSTAVRSSSTLVGVRQFSRKVFPGAFLPVEQVQSRVFDVVKTVKFAPKNVTLSTQLTIENKFDSLLRQDLNQKLAAEFDVEVPAEATEKFTTVKNIVDFFATNPKAR